jgi:hypothetical protein
MSDMDEKKSQVTEKLQKRDEERLADLQKRKDEKDERTASNEKTDFFADNFTRAKIEVELGLANSKTTDKSKLPDHFDSLVMDVHKMQKFLSDSTMFLPAYVLQKAHETIAKLNDAIQESRIELIPKKKFAFKSKKKLTENPNQENVDIKAGSKCDKKTMVIELTEKHYSDMCNQTLSMMDDAILQSDVALARLTDCTVKLLGNPSTLHMNNLQNCTVLCGPVSSSIFVDDCHNCTFVAPCQQLRVHNTQNCTFFLHVTSRAIIEDSSELLFAPYNLDYKNQEQHYKHSGLDQARHAWDDVDDFNWLASDAHSPNWSVLPEDQRNVQWDV